MGTLAAQKSHVWPTDWQHTTVLSAIASIAAQYPNDTAVEHDDRSYTYAELETYSDFIACHLQESKLENGNSVALCLDKSIHAIAAMLGVFKTGAAFVPIDPALPADRINFMLEDADVKAILCAPQYRSHFDNNQIDIKELHAIPDENDVAKINDIGKENVSSIIADKLVINKKLLDEDRAYIMYTSGSTGKPKGVPISHRALLNYCQADAQIYQLHKSDRTLQFSTLSFDIAIEEIFPALMMGSTVVVRPSQRSAAQIELSDIVESYKITALHLATGYWHEWVDLMKSANHRVPETIRLMVVTGEKVSPEHFQRWQALTSKRTLWANAYGPTEATVTATVFIPPPDWQGKSLPIGKPILNYEAYILDETKAPVKPGETGELYIGGPSLADGYLNRPDLTEKAFFPNPFNKDPFNKAACPLMYRTGDLARWMSDGNIEYAGRIDHQIKIGSYRIEPGEIENAINKHTDVKDVLVIADEINNKKMLLTYIATENLDLTACTLSTYLSESLPAYMIPTRYVFLRNLPKTLNGKVDRKALPDGSQAETPGNRNYKAPVGHVQQQLCAIWSDILGVSEVGADSSFISLGGDSLLAVKTISSIQNELGFTLSTRDFFYLDTVSLLAGYIEGKPVARVVPPPTPNLVNKHGRQLYTVLQSPKPELNNGTGVLIVPPLGNEQRRTQRPFRLLMQNLAKQGYTTLRFDWTGTGNSSSNSSDVISIEEWRADIRDAAEALAKNCKVVDLVAVRAGALIAAGTNLSHVNEGQRFYWDPISSGRQWLQEMTLLQQQITSDTYRFLRVRKSDASTAGEFAGLTLSTQMQSALIECNMPALMDEKEWNLGSHLLIANPDEAVSYKELPCYTHNISENNNWTDERKTTVDMHINKLASLTADLLSSSVANSPITNIEQCQYEAREKSSLDCTISNTTWNHYHPKETVETFGKDNQFVGVYTPALKSNGSTPCILYLTAGLLHHIGPTRLHVELARSLSQQQVAGFRFDLSGIGESETSTMGGYFTERSVAEIRTTMDYIQNTYSHHEFVLLGLCSGADDAFATAQEDERVKGLVLLNGYAYKTSKFKLYRFKEFYLPRILMYEKWVKKLKDLFVGPSLQHPQLENSASSAMSDKEKKAVIALDDDYRYIPPKAQTALIVDSLCERGVSMYFVYNGSEHDVYTYKGQLKDMFPEQRNNPQLQEDYIKEADHTYILQTDRDKLTALLSQWLKRIF